MESIKVLNLDFRGISNIIQTLKAVQYDDGRAVRVMLSGTQGNISKVRIYCQKPSGMETYTDGTVVNDYCALFGLTPQMLAEEGIVKSQLQLMDGEHVVTSFDFQIQVSKNRIASSSITSSNEYQALVEALKNVDKTEADISQNRSEISIIKGRVDTAEQNIDVHTAQIAEMQKIPEGGTTADAALNDIKIGYDGTEYDTPGDAVRAQAQGLNNRLEENSENILEETINSMNASSIQKKKLEINEDINGAVITSKGIIVENDDFIDNYHVYKYNITEYIGKVIFIDASLAYSQGLYTIHNEADEPIRVKYKVSSGTDIIIRKRYPIYIPKNSKWLYVSKSLILEAGAYEVLVVNNEKEYSDFLNLSMKKKVKIPLSIFTHSTLSIKGAAYTSLSNIVETYKVSDFFLVSGIKKLIVTCSANYTNAGGVFLDKDYKVVSVILTGDGSTSSKEILNQEIDVPADAMYCALASSTNNELAAYKYVPYINGTSNTDEVFLAQKVYKEHVIIQNGTLTQLEDGNLGYEVHEFDVSALPQNIYVSAGANWGNLYYAFYDAEGSVISKSDRADYTSEGSSITNKLVTTPDSAKLLRVAANPFGKQQLVYVSEIPIEFHGKWEDKNWLVFGDSLTEYNHRTTKPYHYYVREKTGINVLNYGKSGSGYKRLYDKENAFYQRISKIDEDFDVITIFGSGNDMVYANDLGTPSDSGTDTLCGCINTTIDNLFAKYPLANLGIVTPTPWEGYKPGNENSMEKYSNAIVEICKNRGIPCLDLYHCSGLRPWEENFREIAYSKDEGSGTHPDEKGHYMISSKFETFLDFLLLH